jgi:hypothetical protein
MTASKGGRPVTSRQAYDAVAHYLGSIYGSADQHPEDIDLLVLQVVNLNCWDEWEESVTRTLGHAKSMLDPREAFDVMLEFIRLHHEIAGSPDYRHVLESSHGSQDDPMSANWGAWIAGLDAARDGSH